MIDHLKVCKKAKCPYYKFNCTFVGTKMEVNEHTKECKFNNLNDLLVQESFREELMNINNVLSETNSKLQELIVTNNNSKNNDVIQKQIVEKLGLFF